MPKPRLDGVLVSWNDERGFGFIRPSDGSPDAFVHIRDFGTIVGRPHEGDPISYRQAPGRDGRPQALDVRGPARLAAQPAEDPHVGAIFGFIVIAGFVSAYLWANALAPIPISVLIVYFGVSVITFFTYWLDKARARSGGWRVKEATLLTLGLLGGWPGAILGQLMFRHKTKKARFRALFWVSVVVNLAVFAVIAVPAVRGMLGWF